MIKLSDLARQDLDDIRSYTLKTWGREQWHKYFRGLTLTFEKIQEDPSKGRDRSLLVEGMLSVNYGRHVVFFKVLEASHGQPVVLRIVHQKRHFPALVYYDDLDSSEG